MSDQPDIKFKHGDRVRITNRSGVSSFFGECGEVNHQSPYWTGRTLYLYVRLPSGTFMFDQEALDPE